MQKTIETLQNQLIGFRSGTISAGFVDTIRVPYYGQQTPINHLAHTAPGKNGISVVPHDSAMVGQVAKVLKDSGLNAYVFSKTTVMVNVPPVTGDEKLKIHTQVRKLGEEAKISIRNVRKTLKSEIDTELSKDEQKKQEKRIQEDTDRYVSEIDSIVKKKIESI